MSVSGDFAGMLRCDGEMIVHDLRDREPDRELGAHGSAPLLAGHYAAWVGHSDGAMGDIVVYDRTRQRVAYVVHGNELGRDPLAHIAMQADGTVAVSFDPNPNDERVEAEVGWASRTHPRLARVPLPSRSGYSLGIAHGLIAFLRAPKPDPGNRYELGVTTLGGDSELLTPNVPSGSGFDLKGRTIAFAVETKRHGVQVRTRRVRAPWGPRN